MNSKNKKIAFIAGLTMLLSSAFLQCSKQPKVEAAESTPVIEKEEKAPVQTQPAPAAEESPAPIASAEVTPAEIKLDAASPALSLTGTGGIDTDAIAEQAKDALNSAKEEAQAKVEQALSEAKEQAQEISAQAQEKIEAAREQAQEQVQQALETAKEQGGAIAEQAAESVEAAKEQAEKYSQEAQEQAQAAVNNAKEQAQDAINESKDAAVGLFGSTISSVSGRTGGFSTQIAKKAVNENGSYSSKNDVALYLYIYGHLPKNFITKDEAKKLGWTGGGLEAFAPGKSIGGDRFGNREGKLPAKDGRFYTECDIDTKGKSSRGAKRIVFSNDGLIYYTGDHYENFELLYDRSK